MKELGEYLRKTRISNGVSITEAAEDLNFSTTLLENLESGNVRAFKDMYELRESVKVYAKYLGLSPDKIVDEFNDFLFEHTSKISLDDIKQAQKSVSEKKEDNRVKSPYTKEYKEPKKIWPFIYIIMAIVLLFVIIYLIISHNNKVPVRVDELRSKECFNYEFTY